MPRSGALDGLRALAALSVLVFHVWLYRPERVPGARTHLLDKVLFEANLGLICFFVLSGYLLYRPFARAALGRGGPVSVRTYAVRRAARIVPAYYACLAACLVLYAAVGFSSITPSPRDLPLFALFAQNYSMATIMELDPVTWTLCVEAAFYVLLPLVGILALGLGPRRMVHHAGLLMAFVAVTIAWNGLMRAHHWGAIPSKALPAFLGHFALGMLVALWVVAPSRPGGRGGTRALSPAATAALAGTRALSPAATAALAGTGATLVLATAWWHEGRWAGFAAAGQPAGRRRLRPDRGGRRRRARAGRRVAVPPPAARGRSHLLRALPVARAAHPRPRRARRLALAARPADGGRPRRVAGRGPAELGGARAPGPALGRATGARAGRRAVPRAPADRSRTAGAGDVIPAQHSAIVRR